MTEDDADDDRMTEDDADGDRMTEEDADDNTTTKWRILKRTGRRR